MAAYTPDDNAFVGALLSRSGPLPSLIPITNFSPPEWDINPEWTTIIYLSRLNPVAPLWRDALGFEQAVCKLFIYGADKLLDVVFRQLGAGSGLYLAGGSVCRALMGAKGPSDLDIFCVGTDTETSWKAIEELYVNLSATSTVYVFHRRFTLNLYCIYDRSLPGIRRGINIQVILRRYSSLADVLHDFDLGSSSVAYDGRMVYGTPIAAFAYRYGINILDLSVRRGTYEQRLCKYASIGFGVASETLSKDVELAAYGTMRLRPDTPSRSGSLIRTRWFQRPNREGASMSEAEPYPSNPIPDWATRRQPVAIDDARTYIGAGAIIEYLEFGRGPLADPQVFPCESGEAYWGDNMHASLAAVWFMSIGDHALGRLINKASGVEDIVEDDSDEAVPGDIAPPNAPKGPPHFHNYVARLEKLLREAPDPSPITWLACIAADASLEIITEKEWHGDAYAPPRARRAKRASARRGEELD